MENTREAILEIERLIKAQEDAPLAGPVSIDAETEFVYAVDPTPNGRKLGNLLAPPRPAKLSVTTLTGFIDAILAGVCGNPAVLGGKYVVHVEDHLTVSLKTAACDRYGVRDTLLVAKHQPIEAFKFDEYYTDPARFIIATQIAFHQTEEILYLQRLASNLTTGSSVNVQDDGFSQSVTLKAGEVQSAEVKVKPRIKLLPIRTFSEAAPVEGEFLIRFKQTPQQTPSIALFVVDGEKWKGETMRSIKKWLGENSGLPSGLPILARSPAARRRTQAGAQTSQNLGVSE